NAPDHSEEGLDVAAGQTGGRLVEHQERRPRLHPVNRPGDRDTGALRSGELAERPANVEVEAEAPQGSPNRGAVAPPPDLPPPALLVPAAEGEVVRGVEVHDDPGILVHEPQPGTP